MAEQRVLHPELTPEERRRLFWQGIERFNSGRFYDSHDSWEEIWRSTTPEPRDLFQGLVQLAAGMHHVLDRGKPEPARRVLGKGRSRLEPFAPCACGLDVAGVVEQIRAWEAWLATAEGARPPLPRIEVVEPGEVD
jgi:predicted metal-dependent hydrolase